MAKRENRSQQTPRLTKAEMRLIEAVRLLHPSDQRNVIAVVQHWSSPGSRGAATRHRNRERNRQKNQPKKR